MPSDDRFGHHWVQVIRGAVRIGGESFGAGDGAAVEGNGFDIATDDDAEMLVFRLN